MLLAEGLRRMEDRDSLKEVLESQMKAKVLIVGKTMIDVALISMSTLISESKSLISTQVDTVDLYTRGWLEDLQRMLPSRPLPDGSFIPDLDESKGLPGLVTTASTRRMVKLLSRCLSFSEPALLVSGLWNRTAIILVTVIAGENAVVRLRSGFTRHC